MLAAVLGDVEGLELLREEEFPQTPCKGGEVVGRVILGFLPSESVDCVAGVRGGSLGAADTVVITVGTSTFLVGVGAPGAIGSVGDMSSTANAATPTQ